MRNDKDIAKRLYVSGMKLTEIATQLDVQYSILKNWSSLGKWAEIRGEEDNLNEQLVKMIVVQIGEMRAEKGKYKREDVATLKDLMTMRNANHLSFLDKVKLMKDLTDYAISAATHSDSQAVAEITRQYIEIEYDKLEE